MNPINTKYFTQNIEFQLFWLKIGSRVGNANLPLITNAENLHEFISDIDGQSNPFKHIIQQCYIQAKCQSLNSSIDPLLVMNILGESLFELKHHHEPDISLIDLVEHIGLYISQEFISKQSANPAKINKKKASISSAKILNFKDFRNY